MNNPSSLLGSCCDGFSRRTFDEEAPARDAVIVITFAEVPWAP